MTRIGLQEVNLSFNLILNVGLVLKSIYGFFLFYSPPGTLSGILNLGKSLYKEPLNLGRMYKLFEFSWVRLAVGCLRIDLQDHLFQPPHFIWYRQMQPKGLSDLSKAYREKNENSGFLTAMVPLLPYTKICYNVQHNKSLHFTTLYCLVYLILHYPVLNSTMLHWSKLLSTTPHTAIIICTTLHCPAQYSTVVCYIMPLHFMLTYLITLYHQRNNMQWF